MMMSSETTDLARLQAFQLGAADYIPKPFTALEVVLRARRWALVNQRDAQRVILRGTLAELGLPSLLTIFEQERKSGQLSLTHNEHVAWIEFADGKIVHARSTEAEGDARSTMLRLLDWHEGYFELSSGASSGKQHESIGSITHLLLEHAHLRDEARR
jgi:hypothetical protein